MRSRLKCAIFSMSSKSCISTGPRGPIVSEFWLSPTGAPAAVVMVFRSSMLDLQRLRTDGKLGVGDASQVALSEQQRLLVGSVEIGAVNGACKIGHEHTLIVQVQRQADSFH